MTFPFATPPPMDRVYMVSYELKPKRNATGIIEELQSFPKWSHWIESTWMIVTPMTAQEVWDKLAPHIRGADAAIVMEIRSGASYQGWMTKDAWEWINDAPYRSIE